MWDGERTSCGLGEEGAASPMKSPCMCPVPDLEELRVAGPCSGPFVFSSP